MTTRTGKTDYAYVIDDSALERGCDLWFAIPPGFSEVSLGDLLSPPDSEKGQRVVEAVNAILTLVPTESRDDFLTQLASARELAMLMVKEGVVHLSIGTHQADDGRVLESFLTITQKEVPFSPLKLAAVQAATKRRNAAPVAVADLSCGPAAFVEAEVELPAAVDPQQRWMYEITAYLPYPGGRKLAVLTLTTTAVEAREHYRDIHRAIAETVSFDNPLPEEIKERIPESDVAASVRAVFG
ncbi:hypothetical protein SUDANB6_01510 [Streptomyces sp. enrichment culture]|uniref:hypothetical protein n=1 Tax=Streptomyces sp. enrichment culture TaxID=1795815 RepID=UPI003F56BC61